MEHAAHGAWGMLGEGVPCPGCARGLAASWSTENLMAVAWKKDKTWAFLAWKLSISVETRREWCGKKAWWGHFALRTLSLLCTLSIFGEVSVLAGSLVASCSCADGRAASPRRLRAGNTRIFPRA